MSTPHLMIYNEVSIDGKLGGFAGDPHDYYGRAFRWEVDAILMGSVTALNFGPQESADEQRTILDPVAQVNPPAGFEHVLERQRPLLVVPDSRGRVRNWRHAQAQPWYRAILVLISSSTPDEYVRYLDRRGIEYLSIGSDRVDLGQALARLSADFEIRRVRSDAGAKLNSELLRAGLVDEIALLVRPALSSDPSAVAFSGSAQTLPTRYAALELVESETSDDGSTLLRYSAAAVI
ncbi:2,5-diamino-6-(ribosylamino)-4(3H)-pyrimidinone 5'-phosphate reductase [Leifsonia sp. EB41]|uniref:RibD family protein n=1 Tax=Leifsonia sp. EB41 TaxID=3156260 RepID=UPI00351805BA